MHHYSVFQRIFHLSFRANTFSVLLFECKKLDAHSVRNLIFLAYIRLHILNSLPANYNLLSLHSKHDLFRDVNQICYPQNSFGFYLYSDAKFIYDKLSISFFSRFIRIVRKYNQLCIQQSLMCNEIIILQPFCGNQIYSDEPVVVAFNFVLVLLDIQN